MKFKSNKIFLDSETISEQLRSARQEKKLKLADIAKTLNINLKYLEFLEKGNFNKLPQGAYRKNFLREYSYFLGLDYKELEKTLEKELNPTENTLKKEKFSFSTTKPHDFLTTPKIIKGLIILFLVIICFIYLGTAIKGIVAPPFLIIENPRENLIMADKTIKIIGSSESESEIMINGEHIISDKNGQFSKIINLKDGLNIITITAKTKYSQKNTIERQILVKK